MVKILDLNQKDDVEFIERLYSDAFPISERRQFSKFLEIARNNSKFSVYIVSSEDSKNIGFYTVWNFESFVYVEHFAVSPEFRNMKYGEQIMFDFIKVCKLPIIIEVELPSTILSERRIGFYQRIGFKLWEDILYIQPPYHDEPLGIPMKLMTYGDIDLKENLENVRNSIYHHVYGLLG